MSARSTALTTVRANVAVPARRDSVRRASPRPFLKWVGGKTQLLGQLAAWVPERFDRYLEPFLGGGAMFFSHQPGAAVLADVNDELIDCYTAVRDHLDEVMHHLETHRYEKDYYYDVRGWERSSLPLVERAARTIFLNKTGFNGLYRVNSKGLFNVPFGRYSNPRICDRDNLPECSRALQEVELRHADFEAVINDANDGDFVYLDPPYVPLNATANFTAYTAGGFGPDEQRRLASALVRAHRRGAQFLLSNADSPVTRELYAELLDEPGIDLDIVMARRNINSNAKRRGRVTEVVLFNR
jgi:DNA adenine methylase